VGVDLAHEGVHVLLRLQVDVEPDGALLAAPGRLGPLVGGLHEARPPARHDVAPHPGQGLGQAVGLVVGRRPGAARAEPKMVTR